MLYNILESGSYTYATGITTAYAGLDDAATQLHQLWQALLQVTESNTSCDML
jgi:hypothetical protein